MFLWSDSQPSQFTNNNNNNNNSQGKCTSFNLSPISTNSSSSLNNSSGSRALKSFEPHGQKSFVASAIVERDGQLKQQIKRFQLIDELIRETERKSKVGGQSVTSPLTLPAPPFLANPLYNYAPGNAHASNGNGNGYGKRKFFFFWGGGGGSYWEG
jgi:hypothetical protein